MLKLYVPKLQLLTSPTCDAPELFKVTTDAGLIPPARRNRALLVDTPELLEGAGLSGFGLYLLRWANEYLHHDGCVLIPDDLNYLSEGDVIRFDPRRASIKCLWRRSANANSFLITERCNSFCLMCSQPPRDVKDDHLVDELVSAIPLIDQDAVEIGITGGEPTLYGERFVSLLRSLKLGLPRTAIHVLTNGRSFADLQFAARVGRVRHPDLMFGIPLYSDVSSRHDFVVQADGAYDETLRGILNLKRSGQRVEIRVVLHQQTVGRLPRLAEFIVRNLAFVDHVALMGLEVTGFARANLQALFVDPFDYQHLLEEAVDILAMGGLRTSIYNHQLCTIPSSLWPFAVRSISDWKAEYAPACVECDVKDRCGGIFATSHLAPSDHIHPIRLAS